MWGYAKKKRLNTTGLDERICMKLGLGRDRVGGDYWWAVVNASLSVGIA
jgi:hypothetical protein